MIQFSKNILEKFANSEENLYIEILKKGCSGTQIQLGENAPQNIENLATIESNFGKNKKIWVEEKFLQKIDNGTLTLAGEKWIFSQKDSILTRCGCGKSFSFKSGNDAQDKITLLKAKLKQYKHK